MSVPSNGALSEDEIDDDDADNHSSVADGDVATTIDDNQNGQEANTVAPAIVLKQIRRLSSVEAMPPPPPPPPLPIAVPAEENNKSKESKK